MEKYNRGKVYKLVSDKSNLVYYGSTISQLSVRLAKHRSTYKKNLNNEKSNKTAYKLLELDDVKIILVEDFPCERKEQLLARERFYIENNPCVNKTIPGRTNKEWKIKNKDKIKETDRLYKEENKEKLNEQSKLYREKNKEKIRERDKLYYQKNKDKKANYDKIYKEKNKDKLKEQRKERYEKNKDKFNEQQKVYREKNKEEISKKKKEKIQCDCGLETSKSHLARHKKTAKHIKLLDSVNEKKIIIT